MDFVLSFNRDIASLLTPHLSNIALAMTATVLVVFGDRVNKLLKRVVSQWAFVLRVAAFVLMCTFGYGLLTLWGQPVVLWVLTHLPLALRPLLITSVFVFLGLLAERKRYF